MTNINARLGYIVRVYFPEDFEIAEYYVDSPSKEDALDQVKRVSSSDLKPLADAGESNRWIFTIAERIPLKEVETGLQWRAFARTENDHERLKWRERQIRVQNKRFWDNQRLIGLWSCGAALAAAILSAVAAAVAGRNVLVFEAVLAGITMGFLFFLMLEQLFGGSVFSDAVIYPYLSLDRTEYLVEDGFATIASRRIFRKDKVYLLENILTAETQQDSQPLEWKRIALFALGIMALSWLLAGLDIRFPIVLLLLGCLGILIWRINGMLSYYPVLKMKDGQQEICFPSSTFSKEGSDHFAQKVNRALRGDLPKIAELRNITILVRRPRYASR